MEDGEQLTQDRRILEAGRGEIWKKAHGMFNNKGKSIVCSEDWQEGTLSGKVIRSRYWRTLYARLGNLHFIL